MKKSIIVSISLIALIIALVLGYVAFVKPKTGEPINNNTVDITPTKKPTTTIKPEPTPTPTPDETADWLTYRNEEFGFEIKYPEDWFVKSNSTIYASFVNNRYKDAEGEFPDISISIYDNKKDLTLKNWFYDNQSYFFGDIKPKEGVNYKLNDVMVKNYNAIEFSYSRIIKNTLINFNKKVISISANNAIENYDQTLSTFESIN